MPGAHLSVERFWDVHVRLRVPARVRCFGLHLADLGGLAVHAELAGGLGPGHLALWPGLVPAQH